MSLVIKSFSHDVDIGNPKGDGKYYLVVQKDDGKPFRLPVSKETVEKLVEEIYSTEKEAEAPQEPIEPPADDPEAESYSNGATEFGESDPEVEEEEPLQEDPQEEEPKSEEEVPSL